MKKFYCECCKQPDPYTIQEEYEKIIKKGHLNLSYKMNCDAKDLGLLGTGYAMYYEF